MWLAPRPLMESANILAGPLTEPAYSAHGAIALEAGFSPDLGFVTAQKLSSSHPFLRLNAASLAGRKPTVTHQFAETLSAMAQAGGCPQYSRFSAKCVLRTTCEGV